MTKDMRNLLLKLLLTKTMFKMCKNYVKNPLKSTWETSEREFKFHRITNNSFWIW